MIPRTHATSIAAAAVLLVALAGCQAAPAVGAPSAVTTASPAGAAAYPSCYPQEGDGGGAGILAAGSRATRSFVPGFTFTVRVTRRSRLETP